MYKANFITASQDGFIKPWQDTNKKRLIKDIKEIMIGRGKIFITNTETEEEEEIIISNRKRNKRK